MVSTICASSFNAGTMILTRILLENRTGFYSRVPRPLNASASVYEGKKLKFGGRIGTGFSEKLLPTLYLELNKIWAEECPFFNLPATACSRWDQGLTAAEMKRCRSVKLVIVCQIKFTEWTRDDRLRSAGISRNQ